MAFLLVPIGLMLVVGGFYLLGGLHCLLSLKHGHDGLLSDSAISKITWTMIRIGEISRLPRFCFSWEVSVLLSACGNKALLIMVALCNCPPYRPFLNLHGA